MTLVSDDRALADRLSLALAPPLQLAAVPLVGGHDAGPLRLVGTGPVLIDLCPRPDRSVAAIAQVKSGAAERTVLALCDASQGLAPVRQALAQGADDFALRDASAWEIQLRLEALQARPAPQSDLLPLVVGDLELDVRTRTVRRRGQRLQLSGRQFELLRVFMRHPGEPLSQTRLLEEMGLSAQERGSNVVEVHVYHLRRQIGSDRLSTVRGSGYVLHAAAPAM
ncbi:MAG: response regulator transcription factor [Burkholderiaceae bacterium]|nr:response regulator transcription factor [Burkholderiaceae bacterium]